MTHKIHLKTYQPIKISTTKYPNKNVKPLTKIINIISVLYDTYFHYFQLNGLRAGDSYTYECYPSNGSD